MTTRKIAAASRGVALKENSIAWNGDTDFGLTGLLGNANIPQEEVADGATSAVKPWSGKEALEIITDIRTAISGIHTDTDSVHEPDTLLLPRANLDILALKPYSDKVAMPILEYITKPGNTFGLDKVDWLKELETSGVGGTAEMLLYPREEEVLEMFIPMEFEYLPPQFVNYVVKFIGESEVTAPVVRRPIAMKRVYGI